MSADTTPESLNEDAARVIGMAPLALVPVEIFGAEDGYGLMDAVSAWSDCNRAEGRIYRVDDMAGAGRLRGETITVYVPLDQREWFDRRWSEGDPLKSLAAHDAEVARKALTDAADAYKSGQLTGVFMGRDDYAREWLRARAEQIGEN